MSTKAKDKLLGFPCRPDLRRRLDAYTKRSGQKNYSVLNTALQEHLDRVSPKRSKTPTQQEQS